MEIFFNFINKNNEIILLLVSILLIMTWLITFTTTARMNKKLKKYKELTKYTGEKNIEEILEDYARKIDNININANKIQQDLDKTMEKLKHFPQYHSIVRFKAFDNTGSDLSFAIALLDESFNGFVLSSIYGREESITYAKPIENGLSNYHLTKEEEKAIELAKNKRK